MSTGDRLLIVEDDADVRDICRDVAAELGFGVVWAETLTDALERLDLYDPTVILLDLGLPDSDGVRSLHELESRQTQASVVLASGDDEQVIAAVERLGRSLGVPMSGHLEKPVSVERLERALNRARTERRAVTPEAVAAGLAAGEFEAFLQPKVSLRCGASFPVVGAQVAPRWRRPLLGVEEPDAFMPLVERQGLTSALAAKLFDDVVAQLVDWRDFSVAIPITLPLTAGQLADPDFPEKAEAAVATAGASPARLMFSVGEAHVAANPDRAAETLTRLRLKGFAVSLDDFGAGRAPLVHVCRMPLSDLTLDRSLVADIEYHEEARTVARALIDMAGALNLPVCVGGVDTIRAAKLLQDMHADAAQGGVFGEPVARADFTRLLDIRRSDTVVRFRRPAR